MYPKAGSAHSPGKSTNGSIPIPLDAITSLSIVGLRPDELVLDLNL